MLKVPKHAMTRAASSQRAPAVIAAGAAPDLVRATEGSSVTDPKRGPGPALGPGGTGGVPARAAANATATAARTAAARAGTPATTERRSGGRSACAAPSARGAPGKHRQSRNLAHPLPPPPRRHRRRGRSSGSDSDSDESVSDGVPTVDWKALVSGKTGTLPPGAASLTGMAGLMNPGSSSASNPMMSAMYLSGGMGMGGVPRPPGLPGFALGAAGLAPTMASSGGAAGPAGLQGPNAALTKPQRELYVGSVPPGASRTACPTLRALALTRCAAGLTSQQLTEFVNSIFFRAGLNTHPGPPVMGSHINSDGSFAFVEFRSVEECTRGLLLNNVPYGTAALRIGRPKSYTGPATNPVVPESCVQALANMGVPVHATMSAFGASSDGLPAGPQPGVLVGAPSMDTSSAMARAAAAAAQVTAATTGGAPAPIMPGVPGAPGMQGMGLGGLPSPTVLAKSVLALINLPSALSGSMVRQIVSPFGRMTFFEFARNPSGPSAGNVCAFEFAEKPSADAAYKGLQGLEVGDHKLTVKRACDLYLDYLSWMPLLAARAAGKEPPAKLVPTEVMRLSNMVTAAMARDTTEREGIKEDVEAECNENDCRVVEVRVQEPTEDMGDNDVVTVLVRLASIDDALKAMELLEGRRFDGREVLPSYYPVELWEAGVLAQDADAALRELRASTQGGEGGTGGEGAPDAAPAPDAAGNGEAPAPAASAEQ